MAHSGRASLRAVCSSTAREFALASEPRGRLRDVCKAHSAASKSCKRARPRGSEGASGSSAGSFDALSEHSHPSHASELPELLSLPHAAIALQPNSLGRVRGAPGSGDRQASFVHSTHAYMQCAETTYRSTRAGQQRSRPRSGRHFLTQLLRQFRTPARIGVTAASAVAAPAVAP